MHLVNLLESRILSSFVQPLNMRWRNDFIIEPYDEEHGNSHIGNSINAWPVYPLDKMLEV